MRASQISKMKIAMTILVDEIERLRAEIARMREAGKIEGLFLASNRCEQIRDQTKFADDISEAEVAASRRTANACRISIEHVVREMMKEMAPGEFEAISGIIAARAALKGGE